MKVYFEDLELGSADFSSDVQAVVDGYGPTDFLQMDAYNNKEIAVSIDPESDLVQPPHRHEAMDSPESQLLGGPIRSVPHLVRNANPITYVKTGLPPFLLMHGLSDTAVAAHQSELLYEVLLAKGNEATLCLIEGLGHAFFNKNDLDDNEPYSASIRRAGDGETEYIRNREIRIFEMVEEFFQKHLLGS